MFAAARAAGGVLGRGLGRRLIHGVGGGRQGFKPSAGRPRSGARRATEHASSVDALAGKPKTRNGKRVYRHGSTERFPGQKILVGSIVIGTGVVGAWTMRSGFFGGEDSTGAQAKGMVHAVDESEGGGGWFSWLWGGGSADAQDGAKGTSSPAETEALAEDESPALPEAPEGFQWVWVRQLSTGFLVPDGWKFIPVVNKDTVSFYMSPADVNRSGGDYAAGLSVRVVRTIPRFLEEWHQEMEGYAKAGGNPYNPDQQGIAARDKQGLTLVSTFNAGAHSPPPFIIQGALLESSTHHIRMMNIIWFNRKTNAAWILLFEGPVDQWEELWNAYGNTMTTRCALNPDL